MAALIGAIASGSIQFIIEEEKYRKLVKANQIQAHNNLFGCKNALLQYFHSYFLSNIDARSSLPYAKLYAIGLINFAPAKNCLENGKKDDAHKYINTEFESKYHNSPDLKEALRLRESSEKLVLRIGEAKERFWGIIGQIKILFEDTRIEDLIKDIEKAEETLEALDKDISEIFLEIDQEIKSNLNSICIDKTDKDRYAKDPNENRRDLVDKMIGRLEEEKASAIKNAKEKIDILDSKIDDLLAHLEDVLNNPQYYRKCQLFCSNKICPLKPSSEKKQGADGSSGNDRSSTKHT